MKTNNRVTNIFLTGVGGQGAILAGNILSEVSIDGIRCDKLALVGLSTFFPRIEEEKWMEL